MKIGQFDDTWTDTSFIKALGMNKIMSTLNYLCKLLLIETAISIIKNLPHSKVYWAMLST